MNNYKIKKKDAQNPKKNIIPAPQKYDIKKKQKKNKGPK